MNKEVKSLVACVGNDLIADDAAGCAVFERLQGESLPAGTRVELLGVGGLGLLEQLAGEPLLIVVDAVQFGAPVGTVHVLDWEQLPLAKRPAASVHGIGVREAIDIGRQLEPDRCPEQVLVVGIEGACFDEIGKAMSPAVADAIEPAVRQIQRLLAEFN